MKRILYLTFFFKPDLSACSFRNTPLAQNLSENFDGEIDLITTLPNRYATYQTDAKEEEKIGNLNIKRVQIPTHKSGMLGQINSFKTYFFTVLKLVSKKDYDLIFVSSGRLFSAVLGAYLSVRKKAVLYFDIRDIFKESIDDVLRSKIFKLFGVPVISLIENYTFSKPKHINLNSAGFKSYFEERFSTNFSYFPNGIDDVFLGLPDVKSKNDKIVITYAGNFGEAQALDKVVPVVAKELENEVHFKLVGDGGAKSKLINELKAKNIQNVELIDPVPREELINLYLNSDILFVHLDDTPAFKRVLPSKIFEYGSLNKPILAGVAGYCSEFIKENIDHTFVFDPCNTDEMVKGIKKLSNDKTEIDRSSFREKFNRKKIVDELTNSILSYL